MFRIVEIFWQVLCPIFIMILAGYGLQKKFKLQLEPLTKVQLYLFIPALIFIKIATSELDGDMVAFIVSFTVVLFFLLMGLSLIVSRMLHLDRRNEKAFVNAVTLRNQGNFGIPLITLVFAGSGDTFPLSVHMIVLFTTNLLLNTFGIYNTSSGSYSKTQALKEVLKLPMIYVVLLGFFFKTFQIQIPSPIVSTITIWGDAVVPLALFTLGAQLAETPFRFKDKSLPIATFMRLILSPVLAYLMTLVLGIDGIVQEVLILGASAPTAVNSVLFAIEFNGNSEYASESVLLTTALSAITVSITIMLVH